MGDIMELFNLYTNQEEQEKEEIKGKIEKEFEELKKRNRDLVEQNKRLLFGQTSKKKEDVEMVDEELIEEDKPKGKSVEDIQRLLDKTGRGEY